MKKKYNFIDFITFQLQNIPFQSTFSIIYAIVNSLLPAYQTYVMAWFVDCAMHIFEKEVELKKIIIPIILIVIYILFLNIMPVIESIVKSTGKNKLRKKIEDIIIQKSSSLEYMHIESAETQDLVDRVSTKSVANFEKGFNTILDAASILISSISLMIIIMRTTVVSGIIILLISIPLFILAAQKGHQNYEAEKEISKIQRRYKYFEEVLRNRDYAQERVLFGFSERLQGKYKNLYDEALKIEKKAEIKKYATMKSGSLVTLAIIFVIILLLIPPLYMKKITIGLFIALVNAVFSLVQTMSWQLSSTMMEFSTLKEYLKELNLFLALSEKKNACVSPLKKEGFVLETIEFRDVCFKYPNTDIMVLNHCSFILKRDRSYSFVGKNGAGKTTIVKLIVGMYDDYQGEILINGINIKEFDFANIKSMIAVLFQDFNKYEISLKDNIIIGNNMLENNNKLDEVIKKIEIDDMLEKTNISIDTYVGKIKKESIDVSGGEWQKLAIARLLYSEAQIYILDEPTASLDPITESKIYKIFNNISDKQFKIFITHRLGAAKLADEIFVIDNGTVKEMGSHKELMLIPKGLYREMFESQKSWYIN